MAQHAIRLEDVQEAADRIRELVHLTPVLSCSTISGLAGKQLFFKAEIFQKRCESQVLWCKWCHVRGSWVMT